MENVEERSEVDVIEDSLGPLDGTIYVPDIFSVGTLSFHFNHRQGVNSLGDPVYKSFWNNESNNLTQKDGSIMGKRFFSKQTFNNFTRTFTGTIVCDKSQSQIDGIFRRIFVLQFSRDFETVEKGTEHQIDEQGYVKRENQYGPQETFKYKKFDDDSRTQIS